METLNDRRKIAVSKLKTVGEICLTTFFKLQEPYSNLKDCQFICYQHLPGVDIQDLNEKVVHEIGELPENIVEFISRHRQAPCIIVVIYGHGFERHFIRAKDEQPSEMIDLPQFTEGLKESIYPLLSSKILVWLIFASCQIHRTPRSDRGKYDNDYDTAVKFTIASGHQTACWYDIEDDINLERCSFGKELSLKLIQSKFHHKVEEEKVTATDRASKTSASLTNASTKPRGFSRDLFSDITLSKKFICNFCSQVLRQPVQSHCGHRYCKDCFDFIIRNNEDPLCKPCQEEEESDMEIMRLSLSKQFPDTAVKRELEKTFSVTCINPGCDWTGRLQFYIRDHEDFCPLRVSSCPNNCGQQLPWNQVDKHLKDKCLLRTVRCRYCPKSFIANKNKEHNGTCPKFPIRCDMCDSFTKKLPRDQILRHQRTNCPKDKMVCQYGCQNKFSINQAHQHSEENVLKHLDFLRERIKALQEETEQKRQDRYDRNMGNLKQRLSSLQHEVDNLESQIREVNRRVDSLTNKKKDQEAKASESVQRDLEALKLREGVMESKAGTFEGIIAVLNREIEKCGSLLEEYDVQMRLDREALSNSERKCKSFERALALRDVSMAEQDLRIQALETASYDGVMIWKITDFSKKRHDAITGRLTSFYSPAFYTDPHGYKMCCRIYLNGDGMGKGSHISLFFVVMRGYYDALLAWPFKQKVTLMILDQSNRDHVIEAFRPDPASSSFKKPTSDMNIASGCPMFLSLERLGGSNTAYVKDNAMFVKVVVDCTNI